jgi:peptide/nickel transport system substrate-binding protein
MAGYWNNIGPLRRSSRRQLLQRAAAVGAGLAGAGMVACAARGGRSGATSRTTPEAGGQPRRGGTYAVSLVGNPSLDPMQHNDVTTNRVAGAVLSRLFRYTTGVDPNVINNHDLESDLALSAESPDAITWTIRLRPVAHLHDLPPVSGHSVAAEDITASFLRALRQPQKSLRGLLDMIDPNQIQTPAPDTVVFKLAYPYAPFAKLMASPDSSWILPREALAATYDPAKQAIGSGPFILGSSTPDVAFVFRRNPAWFEAGRPYLDVLNRPVILDRAQQLAQFSGGHLDEVLVAANDLDTMQRSNPRATLVKTLPAGNQVGAVYFPLGDASSAFQDIRVRRALSMAIDRDALGKAVFAGQYVVSAGAPPALGKWSLPLSQLDAATQQDYRYNLAEAKRLLQAAGVLDQTFKLAYVTGAGLGTARWYQQSAPAIRDMFASAGLKTVLVAIDFNKDFIDAGKGYAQGYYPKDTILFAVQQPLTEVDQVVFADWHSKSTGSKTQLKDAKIDALIANARTLVDESERLKAFIEVQKYVAQQFYALPIGGQYQFSMIQPRVQNYQAGSLTGEAVETYSKVWLNQ